MVKTSKMIPSIDFAQFYECNLLNQNKAINFLGKPQEHANAGKTPKRLRGATQKGNSMEFLPQTELRLKTLTSNLSVRMSRVFWEFGPRRLSCCVLAAFFFMLLCSSLVCRVSCCRGGTLRKMCREGGSN